MIIVTDERYTDLFTASLILKRIFKQKITKNRMKEVHFDFYSHREELQEDGITTVIDSSLPAKFIPDNPRLSDCWRLTKFEPVIKVAFDVYSTKETAWSMAREFALYLMWLDGKEYNIVAAENFADQFINSYNTVGKTIVGEVEKKWDYL